MSNEKDDKNLEAIKRTRPKQTLEMNTPGGRGLQKDMANKTVARDQARFDNSERAAKYAKLEKKDIANKEHVREGTRGRLSKEHGKSANKEIER